MPYVRNVALNKGLLPGTTAYARFIVLGRSRVGSNFLRGLLNSHSQVVVFGELFQNKDGIGWAMPGFGQTPKTLSLFHRDPVAFLEKKVFGRFPLPVAAVGFKIFYYHAQDESWAPVWTYLEQQTDLRVIHIKRRNILKTHLSRQRAINTNVWVNTEGVAEKHGAITLRYEDCLKDFQETREWERHYDAFFAKHEVLELLYEDLAADYNKEMTRVQAFLGVPHEAVSPETFKQARQPLSLAIANYHELKRRFAGTPWGEFFTE